jgi:hypothetical protein
MSGWTLRNRSIHPITPIASSPSLSESVSLSMADSVPPADGFEDPALPAAQRADHQECATPSPGEVRMDRIERTLQMVTSQLARLQLPPSVAVPVPDPVPPSTCAPTVRVRNRRYATVLAVDSYRLRDRTEGLRPDQISSLTTLANQVRPRLDGCYFSGEPSLSVLPFLLQLVKVSDQSYLSEAALLWIVEDFIRTPAKESFRSQQFESWPTAVHWLLTTYASESSLEIAVRNLQMTSQTSSENVRQFGLRLQLEAAALGSLLSTPEVKSMFTQGLRDPVRSLFTAHQPEKEFEDTTPLSVLIARAELLETGTQNSVPSRVISRSPSLHTRALVLPTDADFSNQDEVSEQAELLALEVRNRPVDGSQWTCFVCYRVGHGWLDCSLLKHVSPAEKEEIMMRRRHYLDSIRPSRSPSFRKGSQWPNPSVNRLSRNDNRSTTPPTSPKNEDAPPLH